MDKLQELLKSLRTNNMDEYCRNIYDAIELTESEILSVSQKIDKKMHQLVDNQEYNRLAEMTELQKQITACISYLDKLLKENTPKHIQQRKTPAPKLTFPMLGIPNGSVITFIDDESITAKVYGEDMVEFEGKLWKLSTLVRELRTRNGTVNISGAYQGGNYFKYKGKILTDIRKEMEDDNKE